MEECADCHQQTTHYVVCSVCENFFCKSAEFRRLNTMEWNDGQYRICDYTQKSCGQVFIKINYNIQYIHYSFSTICINCMWEFWINKPTFEVSMSYVKDVMFRNNIKYTGLMP